MSDKEDVYFTVICINPMIIKTAYNDGRDLIFDKGDRISVCVREIDTYIIENTFIFLFDFEVNENFITEDEYRKINIDSLLN